MIFMYPRHPVYPIILSNVETPDPDYLSLSTILFAISFNSISPLLSPPYPYNKGSSQVQELSGNLNGSKQSLYTDPGVSELFTQCEPILHTFWREYDKMI